MTILALENKMLIIRERINSSRQPISRAIEKLAQAVSSAAYDSRLFNISTVVEAGRRLFALKRALAGRR
ncbi:hypothetical protein ACFLVW_02145 [Chloroflexota bacterium]